MKVLPKASHKTKGFTMIELLVVIAILLILFMTVLFLINPTRRLAQSRDSTRKAHIGQIASAVNAYVAAHEVYPAGGPNAQLDLENDGVIKGEMRDPSTGEQYSFVGYGDELAVYATLEAPDDPSRPYWTFRSACGDADAYSYTPINTTGFESQCAYYANCPKTQDGCPM